MLAPQYDPVAIATAVRSRRRGGDLGADRADVLRRRARASHRRPRRPSALPLLRKDFIVDEYQLLEARAAGADAVLLIVAALEQSELVRLQSRAWELGLAALVEVHDEEELARAVDERRAARSASTTGTCARWPWTSSASDRLAAKMPAGVVGVSESGLQTRGDLERLAAAGYRAFLIGERFMTDPDPARAIADLIGARV